MRERYDSAFWVRYDDFMAMHSSQPVNVNEVGTVFLPEAFMGAPITRKQEEIELAFKNYQPVPIRPLSMRDLQAPDTLSDYLPSRPEMDKKPVHDIRTSQQQLEWYDRLGRDFDFTLQEEKRREESAARYFGGGTCKGRLCSLDRNPFEVVEDVATGRVTQDPNRTLFLNTRMIEGKEPMGVVPPDVLSNVAEKFVHTIPYFSNVWEFRVTVRVESLRLLPNLV